MLQRYSPLVAVLRGRQLAYGVGCCRHFQACGLAAGCDMSAMRRQSVRPQEFCNDGWKPGRAAAMAAGLTKEPGVHDFDTPARPG